MRGRYTDGRTAREHEVEARLESGALVFAVGAEHVRWPLDGLRRIETPDRTRVILEPLEGEGARLSLPAAEAGPLLAAVPKLARAARAGSPALALGLTLAAAAIVGTVFFGLPALSGPIARAIPPAAESRIGGQSLAVLDVFTDACVVDAETQAVLDGLADRFEAVSNVRFALEIRVVDAGFPNAFALPGGRILVTDELLAMMESPEELAGVLAHETAHIERRHVMAALVREIGYGFVLDLVLGGGSGAGQQIALAGASLDSLRHSRNAEAEADALALGYLEAAGIDGRALAAFFDRINIHLAEQRADGLDLELPELLSTHPDTERRAEDARAAAGPARGAALPPNEWARLRAACAGAVVDDGGALEPEEGGDAEP